MKKYIFAFICLLLFAGIIHAQQKKSLFKFGSINSIGLLNGQSQTIFTMQTINGIKYKTWFTGLGASLDAYGYRSIPAFVDIRKTFGNKTLQPFVYADAGINFPLYSNALPRKLYGSDAYKLYNSFYGETGIGISRKINNKLKFVISAGYSYKHFSYLQYNRYYYSGPVLLVQYPPYMNNNTQYDFYYRRLSVKMGLQF